MTIPSHDWEAWAGGALILGAFLATLIFIVRGLGSMAEMRRMVDLAEAENDALRRENNNQCRRNENLRKELVAADERAGSLQQKVWDQQRERELPKELVDSVEQSLVDIQDFARKREVAKQRGVWNVGRGKVKEVPESPAKIISVSNLKGGVGKSTISANVAAVLADMGKKVLVVDLDWQQSLTRLCLTREQRARFFESGYAPVCTALKNYTKTDSWTETDLMPLQVVRETGTTFDLAPTHFHHMDREDAALLTSFAEPAKDDARFLVRNLIRKWSQEYDLVILDCPPRLTVSFTGALAASDLVLVPIIPDQVSIDGAGLLFSDPLFQLREVLWPDRFPHFALIGNKVRGTMVKQARAMADSAQLQLRPQMPELIVLDSLLIEYVAYGNAAMSDSSEVREFGVDLNPRAMTQATDLANEVLAVLGAELPSHPTHQRSSPGPVLDNAGGRVTEPVENPI
ncbi:MAG: AAA family ATPase [Verrucomicrobiota bacterium]